MIFVWIYLIGYGLWFLGVSVYCNYKHQNTNDIMFETRGETLMTLAVFGLIVGMVWPICMLVIFFMWLGNVVLKKLTIK